MLGGMRGAIAALGVSLAACAAADSKGPTEDTTVDNTAGSASGSDTPTSASSPPVPDDATTSGGDATAGAVTTTGPTMADSDSATTSPPPPGPECSVQEVTEGDLLNPVDKANEAGRIPVNIGDALEDYCGCHTLMNNGQNLKYAFLKAPGGTLFLNYDDLSRPFGGGTLGAAMAEQTLGNTMPPGSCSFPGDPAALLDKWFLDGMPDGATFEYP